MQKEIKGMIKDSFVKLLNKLGVFLKHDPNQQINKAQLSSSDEASNTNQPLKDSHRKIKASTNPKGPRRSETRVFNHPH